MKYIIAGKSDSVLIYLEYLKKNNYISGKTSINVRTLKEFNQITENDTIVLLKGWWGKSWAKQAIKDIMINYPEIDIEYLDGIFGEIERKTLKSDTIYNRFELLDL